MKHHKTNPPMWQKLSQSLLFSCLMAFTMLAQAGSFQQSQYITQSDPSANDLLGFSTAVSGDTLVVGAYTQPNTIIPSIPQGAVYVYTRSSVGGSWGSQVKLTDVSSVWFGFSIAIEGDTLVIGAPAEPAIALPGIPAQSGAVYIYTRDGAGNWSQQSKLVSPNPGDTDGFGSSVGISGDTVVVGAVGEDGDGTSTSAAFNDGAADSGAAYVFTRDGSGNWNTGDYLKAANVGADDQFGRSVGISGNRIVVGAYQEDGDSTSSQSSPNDAAADAGVAYVYLRTVNTWSHEGYLKPADAATGFNLGRSVSISGNTAIVGAVGADGSAGAAYVFTHDGAAWSEQTKLTAGNPDPSDEFGKSVAIEGDTAVVGAYKEQGSASSTAATPDNTVDQAGAVYVFTRTGTAWTQQDYLKSSNAETLDRFGRSVAISGDTLAVGANQEDGVANAISNAGAAYVFKLNTSTPGDETGDGTIDILDVIAVINLVLNSNAATNGGDCNANGGINILDVICTINKVLAP